MKKMSKFLAILLSVVVFASAFAVASSAISSSSSAKEMLDFYENAIISTSAKEDVIKAVNTYKSSSVPDFSSLSEEDREATKEMLGWYIWEEDDSEESSYETYFYGDDYKDYYEEGRSEFIDYFSIKRDIRRWDLKYKSAKLSESKNGDVTLKFVYEEDIDGTVNTLTYTAVIAKNGYIKSYTFKRVAVNSYESFYENVFTAEDTFVDSYKFVYKEVSVKDISLETDGIVFLGRDQEEYVTPIITPENATYKGVWAVSNDIEVADCFVEEDGSIYIYGVGPGSTTIEIYTYDGEFMAELQVDVHYSLFDYIIGFFENFLAYLFESLLNFYF